jgi:hypothetical protein
LLKPFNFSNLEAADIILGRRKKCTRKIVLPKDTASDVCAYLPFSFFNFKPNFAL